MRSARPSTHGSKLPRKASPVTDLPFCEIPRSTKEAIELASPHSRKMGSLSTAMEPGVVATESARELVRSLMRAHGPLMFHQSGACRDGSAPMCYPRGDFLIGARDVLLGSVEGCEYYVGSDPRERSRDTRLILDVVPGRSAGFSLEAPEGVRFIIRSEPCTAP